MPALGLLPPHVGQSVFSRCIPPYEPLLAHSYASRATPGDDSQAGGWSHSDQMTRTQRICRFASDAITFHRQPFTEHMLQTPKDQGRALTSVRQHPIQ